MLPYLSGVEFELLKRVLPPEKFVPVSERVPESDQKCIIEIPERSNSYHDLVGKMHMLHQANHDKLIILQNSRKRSL